MNGTLGGRNRFVRVLLCVPTVGNRDAQKESWNCCGSQERRASEISKRIAGNADALLQHGSCFTTTELWACQMA